MVGANSVGPVFVGTISDPTRWNYLAITILSNRVLVNGVAKELTATPGPRMYVGSAFPERLLAVGKSTRFDLTAMAVAEYKPRLKSMDPSILETIPGSWNFTGLPFFGSQWNAGHIRLANGSHIWQDVTGQMRIKSSAPTSDTDGLPIGGVGPHQIFAGAALVPAGTAATTTGIGLIGLGSLLGAAAWQSVFRIDPTKYPAWATLAITLECDVDDTAPAANFTGGLYAVSAPVGAAGAMHYTQDANIGSSPTVTAPAARSSAAPSTAGIAMPAAGLVATMLTISATVAANSSVRPRVVVEVVY